MYLRGCTRFERASISQGRIIFEKSFTEFGGGGEVIIQRFTSSAS